MTLSLFTTTYLFSHFFSGVLAPRYGEENGNHSSTLAWKIPWTERPGRLQSMGSLRVGTTEQLHFHFHALEKEMATHSSVLASGESQGWRSLVGCRLWGRTESDMTEAT